MKPRSISPLRLLLATFVAALGTALVAPSAFAGGAPSVTTGTVNSVTPTSVSVNGTVNPNGLSTSWSFQYGTSTSYGSNTAINNAGSGTSAVNVASTIGSLHPSTAYHYRLTATNSSGTTNGIDGTFTTAALPLVTTGSATSITASSARLNASINTEGATTSWYFEYGSSSAYGSRTSAHSLSAGAGTASVGTSISGLTPKVTYHFRVVASSSAGTVRGSDATFVTGLPVTIAASEPTIVFGQTVILSGVVSGGKSGTGVAIFGQAFGQVSSTDLATVRTDSSGHWSFIAQPPVRTTYIARADSVTSSPFVVAVRPAVLLTKLNHIQASTRVVAAVPFVAHVVQLQKFTHRRWVTIKLLHLGKGGRTVFRTSLLPGGRSVIRVAIGATIPGVDQAAPGYLAGYSPLVHFHR